MDRREIVRALFLRGYYLVDSLGRGSEGEVFLVSQEDHPYACKVRSVISENSMGIEARVLKELQSIGPTTFPAFRENFTEGGLEYLVMEYIRGETLKDYLLRSRVSAGSIARNDIVKDDIKENESEDNVSEENESENREITEKRFLTEILRIAGEIADALTILSELNEGYSYGDLKPDNIIVDLSGRARLIDLGGATPLGGCRNLSNCGYGAPENVCGNNHTPSGDIYAMGRLLKDMRGLLSDVPDSIRWLDRVIDRCLSPEPTRRVNDMRQLSEYLKLGFGKRPVDYREHLVDGSKEYMSVQNVTIYG